MTTKTKGKDHGRSDDDQLPARLSPDVLDLDHENPRLVQTDYADLDEPELIKFLWREMNVEELALSIAAWGYFDHEPLFAIKRGSRYVVIEGNRRLAAVKILRSPELQKALKTDLPPLTAAIKADTDLLPVVITTRAEIWQYIGFKHVNGPKPWGALAKARYIAYVVNELDVELSDIPRLIGDTHATVRRLYRGLMVLEQAEEEGIYHTDDRTPKRLFFSHLYTGLGHPGIQDFIGIKEETSYKPKPVRGTENKKHLAALCVWMFGSKEQRRQPLVKSQNPDLRHLAEALQTERGRDALTAGLPLEVAYEASIGDPRQFRESLIQAKTSLEKAWGKVHTGFDIKSDQLATARAVGNLAERLIETMETLETKPAPRKPKK